MNELCWLIKTIQGIEISYSGGLAIVDIMMWLWFIYCVILSFMGYTKIIK